MQMVDNFYSKLLVFALGGKTRGSQKLVLRSHQNDCLKQRQENQAPECFKSKIVQSHSTCRKCAVIIWHRLLNVLQTELII